MVSRRDLKTEHEGAVLRQFKDHLESAGSQLDILERPEPPEALVELNGQKTWIEITDAFLDQKHAIGLTTAAADDVAHIPDGGRIVVDPDEMFSAVLHKVIEAKYNKASMIKVANDLGLGILLVGIFTPFTTARAVTEEETASIAKLVLSKPVQIFDRIYAYDGTGRRSFHLAYRREA